MWKFIRNWYDNNLSDPQTGWLLAAMVWVLGSFQVFRGLLTPIFIGLVLAYLLNGSMQLLQKNLGISEQWGFILCYSVFMGAYLSTLLVFPLLFTQLNKLFNEMPAMLSKVQTLMQDIATRHPDMAFIPQSMNALMTGEGNLLKVGQYLGAAVLSFIPGLFHSLIYVLLVPLSVFFFLKDRVLILSALKNMLPEKNDGILRFLTELHRGLGHYVIGKGLQMLLLMMISILTFMTFGLDYAVLLGVLVGISTLIPYIGALLVTIPVVLVAFFQWGLGSHYQVFILSYAVIQFLDGNLIMPLIFSGVLSLHPLVILAATLVFGDVLGAWGLFLGVPLAFVVKTAMTHWPKVAADIQQEVIAKTDPNAHPVIATTMPDDNRR